MNESSEAWLSSGWRLHAVCPYPHMPGGIHARLMGQGNEVVDLPFREDGALVGIGQYALWTRPKG